MTTLSLRSYRRTGKPGKHPGHPQTCDDRGRDYRSRQAATRELELATIDPINTRRARVDRCHGGSTYPSVPSSLLSICSVARSTPSRALTFSGCSAIFL